MLINHESVEYIFFFNDTATTEIYTLSLHDALPIFSRCRSATRSREGFFGVEVRRRRWGSGSAMICRFIYAVEDCFEWLPDPPSGALRHSRRTAGDGAGLHVQRK